MIVCGSCPLQVYTHDAGLSKEVEVGLSFAVSLIGFVVDCLLIDKTGRKVMMKVGLGVSTFLLVALAVVYEFERSHVGSIKVMTLTILNLHGLIYDSFVGGIPWIYNVEIHPTGFKGIASSLASICSFITDWLVCKSLPSEMKNLSSYTLLIYAMLSLIGIFLVKSYLPETLRREAQAIPLRIRRKKSASCMFWLVLIAFSIFDVWRWMIDVLIDSAFQVKMHNILWV